MIMNVPQMILMGWINFFFSGFVVRGSLKLKHKKLVLKPLATQ